MPRSLRIDYPGAVYHVTARGVQQAAIFIDDRDRQSLLAILARILVDGDASAFAYCLMGNHYHFVLQTRLPNLSKLMHRVNTSYGLTFNKRHGRHGAVFEGRFKAFFVDRDAYLLEACRYVDLNPVRAGMVDRPDQWKWSSYRAHVGTARQPAWLDSAFVRSVVGDIPCLDERNSELACRRYAEWVWDGRGVRLWEVALKDGQYLGDDGFVARVQALRSGHDESR